GTVTSDSSGLYKVMWTPDTEGEYTIYATFDGSNSYWGSYATTALGVAQATDSSTQTATDYTLPIIGSAVAVIIAVVLATVLILKKKQL
ncbi:MAG: hypothetical protein FWG55_02280, partial [Candidatus Bathyarchaeota archaeon]|nr:hypothetical protein [Candidatus Termiticorpusculum sp.]